MEASIAAASAGAGTTVGTARGRGGRALLGLALGALILAPGARAASPPGETVEVVVSRDGVRPKVLNSRKGETLRLLVRTADEEHCFALDALRVEKRIVPGRTTTIDLTPDRVGTFPYHCCLEPGNEAQKGRLVVAE